MDLKKTICLLVCVILAVLCVVFVSLGSRDQALVLGRLPVIVTAGDTITGELSVEPGNERGLRVTSSDADVRISRDSSSFSWTPTSEGRTEIRFSLIRRRRSGNDQQLDEKIWTVTVTPAAEIGSDGRGVDAQPPHEEPAVTEVDRAGSDGTEPVNTAPESDPAIIEVNELEPVDPSGLEMVGAETKDPDPADQVVELPVEPPPLPLPSIGRLENELFVRLEGKTKLYARGRSTAGTPRAAFVRGKLIHVRFEFDAAAEPRLADAEIHALLAVGAEYIDDTDPLSVPLDVHGLAAVRRVGHTGIRLPAPLWGVVFSSANIITVVNRGHVIWRIARYEPVPDAFAVVIRRNDIDKK